MPLAVLLITLAAALYLVHEAFRRVPRWVAWGVCLGLPCILTPHWVQENQIDAFPWVKLYSILVGACWITALRYTCLGHCRWALLASSLMLPLNILEAVVQDLCVGNLAHVFLAATGSLLAISVPYPTRVLRIEISGPQRDLHYEGLTRPWIVGYTLWNGAFVYLNFPNIAAHQAAVLAAAFVVGMIEPRLWLQARTYTLATSLLMLFTFPRFLVPLLDSSDWAAPGRENGVAVACLLLATLYVAYGFVRRRGGVRLSWCGNERPTCWRGSRRT